MKLLCRWSTASWCDVLSQFGQHPPTTETASSIRLFSLLRAQCCWWTPPGCCHSDIQVAVVLEISPTDCDSRGSGT